MDLVQESETSPVTLIGRQQELKAGAKHGIGAELRNMGSDPSYEQMLALATKRFHSEDEKHHEVGDGAPELDKISGQSPETEDEKKYTANGGKKVIEKKSEEVVAAVIKPKLLKPKIIVYVTGVPLKGVTSGYVPRLSSIHIEADKATNTTELFYTVSGPKVRFKPSALVATN